MQVQLKIMFALKLHSYINYYLLYTSKPVKEFCSFINFFVFITSLPANCQCMYYVMNQNVLSQKCSECHCRVEKLWCHCVGLFICCMWNCCVLIICFVSYSEVFLTVGLWLAALPTLQMCFSSIYLSALIKRRFKQHSKKPKCVVLSNTRPSQNSV